MKNGRQSLNHLFTVVALAIFLGGSVPAWAEIDYKKVLETNIEILSNQFSEINKVKGAIHLLTHTAGGKEPWVRERLRTLIEHHKFENSARFYDVTEVYAKNFKLGEPDVRALLGGYSRLPKEFSQIKDLVMQLAEAQYTPEGARSLIKEALTEPDFKVKHLYLLASEFQARPEFAIFSESILSAYLGIKGVLTDGEKLNLVSIAMSLGRGNASAVSDTLWLALKSDNYQTLERAVAYASKLKKPEPRFLNRIKELLKLPELPGELFIRISEIWNINDDETLKKIANLLKTETDSDSIDSILTRLKNAEYLPPDAHREVLDYLDRNPGSAQVLPVLARHRPGDPNTIEYAAKALGVPESGAQALALEILKKAEPLDSHTQGVLAEGFLNGNKDYPLKVGLILKNHDYEELEDLLLTELRKGKKARNVEQIAKLIQAGAPWSTDFDEELNKLAKKRNRHVKAAAKLAVGATQKSLLAGADDVERILLEQLDAAKTEDRLKSVDSLSLFKGDEHIAHLLVARLAHETDLSVREKIAQAFPEIGVTDFEVQNALWDMVVKEDGLPSIRAVKVLQKIRPIDPALYPKIAEIIAAKSTGGEFGSLYARSVLQGQLPLELELRDMIVQAIFTQGYSDISTVGALGVLGIKRPYVESEALLALNSPDPRVRAGAALIKLSKESGGAEITARALLTEVDPGVRKALMSNLLHSIPNGLLSRSAILDFIEKSDSHASEHAFKILENAPNKLDASFFPRLEKIILDGIDERALFGDAKKKVQRAANLIQYVRGMGPNELERIFRLISEIEEDDHTRRVLKDAFKQFKPEQYIPVALKVITNGDADLRKTAAGLLQPPFFGDTPTKAQREYLLAWQDWEPEIQRGVFLALQKEKVPSVRLELWASARGDLWAHQIPDGDQYLEAMLRAPNDNPNDSSPVLRMIGQWSEESPTLLHVLANYEDVAHAKHKSASQEKAAKGYLAKALAKNPDFAEVVQAMPQEACVPGRLSRLWQSIKNR